MERMEIGIRLLNMAHFAAWEYLIFRLAMDMQSAFAFKGLGA